MDDASSYINQKAPLNFKEITVKEAGGVWYNIETRETKKFMRKAETCIKGMAITIINFTFV